MMAGFIIFVIWFFALWGLASVLTDQCGMVMKYAFPLAFLVVTIPAGIAVWLCYGQDHACWVAGASVFVNVCIWISGGL